jgi:hypothetical protein
MRSFYFFTLAAVLLLVTSCDKSSPDNDGTVISRIETSDEFADYSMHFLYDERGRLVRMEHSNKPRNQRIDVRTTWLLNYDATGKLSTMHSIREGEYDLQRQYYFNTTGDTIRIVTTWTQSNGTFNNKNTVILDNQHRVIADSTHLSSSEVAYVTYTYTPAGDMGIKKIGTYTGGVASPNTSELVYSYDNHNNPYRPLGLVYYLATENDHAFSVHNWLTLQINSNPSSVPAQYIYNKSDMPLSFFVPSGNVNVKGTTYKYYYWR